MTAPHADLQIKFLNKIIFQILWTGTKKISTELFWHTKNLKNNAGCTRAVLSQTKRILGSRSVINRQGRHSKGSIRRELCCRRQKLAPSPCLGFLCWSLWGFLLQPSSSWYLEKHSWRHGPPLDTHRTRSSYWAVCHTCNGINFGDSRSGSYQQFDWLIAMSWVFSRGKFSAFTIFGKSYVARAKIQSHNLVHATINTGFRNNFNCCSEKVVKQQLLCKEKGRGNTKPSLQLDRKSLSLHHRSQNGIAQELWSALAASGVEFTLGLASLLQGLSCSNVDYPINIDTQTKQI